jgi:hypothetical protein
MAIVSIVMPILSAPKSSGVLNLKLQYYSMFLYKVLYITITRNV